MAKSAVLRAAAPGRRAWGARAGRRGCAGTREGRAREGRGVSSGERRGDRAPAAPEARRAARGEPESPPRRPALRPPSPPRSAPLPTARAREGASGGTAGAQAAFMSTRRLSRRRRRRRRPRPPLGPRRRRRRQLLRADRQPRSLTLNTNSLLRGGEGTGGGGGDTPRRTELQVQQRNGWGRPGGATRARGSGWPGMRTPARPPLPHPREKEKKNHLHTSPPRQKKMATEISIEHSFSLRSSVTIRSLHPSGLGFLCFFLPVSSSRGTL